MLKFKSKTTVEMWLTFGLAQNVADLWSNRAKLHRSFGSQDA